MIKPCEPVHIFVPVYWTTDDLTDVTVRSVACDSSDPEQTPKANHPHFDWTLQWGHWFTKNFGHTSTHLLSLGQMDPEIWEQFQFSKIQSNLRYLNDTKWTRVGKWKHQLSYWFLRLFRSLHFTTTSTTLPRHNERADSKEDAWLLCKDSSWKLQRAHCKRTIKQLCLHWEQNLAFRVLKKGLQLIKDG